LVVGAVAFERFNLSTRNPQNIVLQRPFVSRCNLRFHWSGDIEKIAMGFLVQSFLLSAKIMLPFIYNLSSVNSHRLGIIPQGKGNHSSKEREYCRAAFQ
jgi:hypothetical protein